MSRSGAWIRTQASKQYATELREGGTRALGTGVPAVSHDQLNALPASRWEREKSACVYETWVKQAAASYTKVPK